MITQLRCNWEQSQVAKTETWLKVPPPRPRYFTPIRLGLIEVGQALGHRRLVYNSSNFYRNHIQHMSVIYLGYWLQIQNTAPGQVWGGADTSIYKKMIIKKHSSRYNKEM